MTTKFVVLVACVAAASAGLVRRETSDPVADFQKHTKGFLDTFQDQLQKFPAGQHSEEFHQMLKATSETFGKELSELGKNLQAFTNDAGVKVNQLLERNKQQIKKAADELEHNDADVHAKADHLKSTISSAVSSAVEATQDLAKAVSSNVKDTGDKVTPQIKSAFDSFVAKVQELQKNLLEASTKQ